MPFPPTPSVTPSNTPTSSVTPSNTPSNTPTQTICPTSTPTSTPTPTTTMTPTPTMTPAPCICFGLVSDELFTIDYIDCYGEFQNAIAVETFPGQWTIYVCAYSYTLTSGTIDEENTNDCFLTEGGWSCPQ